MSVRVRVGESVSATEGKQPVCECECSEVRLWVGPVRARVVVVVVTRVEEVVVVFVFCVGGDVCWCS